MVAAPSNDSASVTFTKLLEKAADRRVYPAIWSNGWRTWRDLLRQSERTASVLHEKGLKGGDVVGAWLPSGWELLVLHAATARLGILLLPLHSAHRIHEVRSLLGQAEAVGLVAQDGHRARDRVADVLAVQKQCKSLRHVWSSSGNDGSLASGQCSTESLFPADSETSVNLPPVPQDPNSSLLLLASSGTTSRQPKLCVHSHAGLLGNAAVVAADGAFGHADTVVSASPLSHAFGMLSAHLALVTSGAVGFVDGWDPKGFIETLRSTSASVAFGVPAQLRDLVAIAENDSVAQIPRLREIRTGGAPVSRELADALRGIFGTRVVVQWGMTEIGAGTYTRPEDSPDAVATVGRPASGSEVRVVADDGTPLRPGQTGMLQYRGPNVFLGYYRAPEMTKVAFSDDGWLRCGDLATVNPDGSVTYRGRTDEMINRGGLKFSAIEVEELLDDFPQLVQHAIIAEPDARLGQRSCLIAVARDEAGVTLEQVSRHLRGKRLATYKLPERLVVVDQMPTTVTGKIARGQLQAIVRPSAESLISPESSPGPNEPSTVPSEVTR